LAALCRDAAMGKPANPVVHDGDRAESFQTGGRGRGPGDGKKLRPVRDARE
jgi:hypothetical protein